MKKIIFLAAILVSCVKVELGQELKMIGSDWLVNIYHNSDRDIKDNDDLADQNDNGIVKIVVVATNHAFRFGKIWDEMPLNEKIRVLESPDKHKRRFLHYAAASDDNIIGHFIFKDKDIDWIEHFKKRDENGLSVIDTMVWTGANEFFRAIKKLITADDFKMLLDYTIDKLLPNIAGEWSDHDNSNYYKKNEDTYVEMIELIILFYKDYYGEGGAFNLVVKKLSDNFRCLGGEMKSMLDKYSAVESNDGSSIDSDADNYHERLETLL